MGSRFQKDVTERIALYKHTYLHLLPLLRALEQRCTELIGTGRISNDITPIVCLVMHMQFKWSLHRNQHFTIELMGFYRSLSHFAFLWTFFCPFHIFWVPFPHMFFVRHLHLLSFLIYCLIEVSSHSKVSIWVETSVCWWSATVLSEIIFSKIHNETFVQILCTPILGIVIL